MAARVSRLWNDVALDYLWRDIKSILPLLEILSPLIKTKAEWVSLFPTLLMLRTTDLCRRLSVLQVQSQLRIGSDFSFMPDGFAASARLTFVATSLMRHVPFTPSGYPRSRFRNVFETALYFRAFRRSVGLRYGISPICLELFLSFHLRLKASELSYLAIA